MLLHYFLILGTLYLSILAQQKKIVCYWNSDSDKHDGLRGYFRASDIDPTICTHIIYKSISYSQGLVLYFSPLNYDKSQEFLNLKLGNPNVKLLIGVGGYGWGATVPSNLTSTPTRQQNLALAIKSFLDSHTGFDGVDFDWQWPGDSGYQNDKDNYASFLSTLRSVITSEKILSVSVAPRNEDIEKSYDIPRFIDYVDFINLNAFDMRGYKTDTSTAFHSPYRKNPADRNPESEWNAVSIVSSWKTRFVPTDKLTLGIPTYGRSFTLLDPSENYVDSPISGLGRASIFQPQSNAIRKNIIPYSEICYNLKQGDTTWESIWSETHFTPYATYDDDQWVGYDDEVSVLAKIHLVIENDFAGINYAALDYDDFSGFCNTTTFPLIRLGYDALINGIVDPNPASTTASPRPGETSPFTQTTEEITEEITSTEATTETPTEATTEATTLDISTTEAEQTTSVITTTETEEPTVTTEEPTISTTEIVTTTEEPSSSTSKPSTISKTTTTRTTTSELPTPPVTPNRSTDKASEDSTSTPNLEILTTIAQSTEQITTETEASTTSTDFKTPPVTLVKSSSMSTTEGSSL